MKTWQDLLDHFEGTEVGDKLKNITPLPLRPVAALYIVLAGAFKWADTVEGYDYWERVSDELWAYQSDLEDAKRWWVSFPQPPPDKILLELYRNRKQ